MINMNSAILNYLHNRKPPNIQTVGPNKDNETQFFSYKILKVFPTCVTRQSEAAAVTEHSLCTHSVSRSHSQILCFSTPSWPQIPLGMFTSDYQPPRWYALTMGSHTWPQTLGYLKDVNYSLLHFHFKNIIAFILMTSAMICLQHAVISSDLEAPGVPLNEGY